MCSTINGLNHLMLQFAASQSANLTKTNDDDMVEWCIAFTIVARLFAYIAILALMVIIIVLIMRYIGDFDNSNNEDVSRTTERSPLMPGKVMPFTYGSCEGDLEAGGECSSGSTSTSSGGSSPELYDGKICIICYDEERNCFFVPCGHCATCYDCAQRIFNGENKVCPVCRRFIGKVRKLFAS